MRRARPAVCPGRTVRGRARPLEVPRPGHRRPALLVHRFEPAAVGPGLHRAADAGGYAVGLPDGATDRARAALVAALVATFVAAVGISLAQLAVGVALLPRFVVLGSSMVLVPWYLLCARLAADVDARAKGATRVVVVGDLADVSSLWLDLESNPVRPATIAGRARTCEEAKVRPQAGAARRAGPHVSRRTWSCSTPPRSRTRRSCARRPSCTRRGVRVRSLLVVLRGVAGQAAALRARAGVDDVRHRRGPRRFLRAAQAAARPGARRSPDVVVLALATPFVVVGNLLANRGPLMYRQERVGKDGELFTILKFRTMRVAAGGRRADGVDDARRPAHHTLGSGAATRPRRRAAPGVEHPARRPVGRRPASGATALRAGAHRQVALLPVPAPRAAGPDRVGPR